LRYDFTVIDMTAVIPPKDEAARWLRGVLEKLGCHVEAEASKIFPDPPGHEGGRAYTVAFILSESHAIIHTAPEHSWIEVIFAFCKEIPLRELVMEARNFFAPRCYAVKKFDGSPPGV